MLVSFRIGKKDKTQNYANNSKLIKWLPMALSAVLAVGCSTNNVASKADPLEPLNRGIFKANMFVDALYIRPVSTVYDTFTPPPMKQGVSNALNNLTEVPTIVNSLLQGNGDKVVNGASRFVINTVLGIGGLFDVAAGAGIERKKETFGNTLGRWGYKNSSYLVLPILGPSTIRDTIGIFADTYISIPHYMRKDLRHTYYIIDAIDKRMANKEVYELTQVIGVDKYTFVRDAYLQRRNYVITGTNGAPASNSNTNMQAGGTNFLGEPPE